METLIENYFSSEFLKDYNGCFYYLVLLIRNSFLRNWAEFGVICHFLYMGLSGLFQCENLYSKQWKISLYYLLDIIPPLILLWFFFWDNVPLEGREGLTFTDRRAGLCKEPHSFTSSFLARFVYLKVKNGSRLTYLKQAMEGFLLVQGKWLECASGLSCPQSFSTILVLQLVKPLLYRNSHVPCLYLWTHQLLPPSISFTLQLSKW